MVWNFGLSLAGPFFSVYRWKICTPPPQSVGILSIVSSLAGLPALRFFGSLNDRWGARKVTLLTGFLIPLVPVMWAFTTSALARRAH